MYTSTMSYFVALEFMPGEVLLAWCIFEALRFTSGLEAVCQVNLSRLWKCLQSIAGTGSAEVQPPFQAVPGLEVLYGGLGSLWRLPLQQSSASDALFDRYLAAHPLSARQNRTLAEPKPPTPPGFGAHMTPHYIRIFS